VDRAGLVFQAGARSASGRRCLFFCDAELASLIPLLRERVRKQAEGFHAGVIFYL